MPERRSEDRPEGRERRSFPRPPLWLNLLLLILGIGGVFFVRSHRERVSTEFSKVINEQQRTPSDVKRIKEELAEMDLTREALKRELEGRMKLATNLKQEDFYLAIDTKRAKLRFTYAGTTLRESDLTLGESKTFNADGKSWTFVPVKGAFPVEAKIVDYAWPVPEWVYAMKGQPVPSERPTLRDGLGKYVIFLPNGYVIHTQPSADSPLQGAKPGSYMVDEDTMRAIWPRIRPGNTQVYIF